MAIIFKTFEQIEIDGQSAGNIVDVLSNHGPRRAEVLAAFGVYTAGLRTALDDEKTQLASAHKAEIDSTNATIARLESDLSTASSELESVTASNESLQTQLDSTTDQLNLANNTLATVNALVATLHTKVETLQQNQRFDPRQINAKAFYNRITKEEFALLAASPDPQLTGIAQAILAYAKNEKTWPVVFKSVEMQGMVDYLLQSGFLTQSRIDQLTADATWQEAFYPQ
jgi:ATP-dependent Clp protease ATP-binding subunit ClpA